MPTISSSDKVLVTGANGYVGLWIIKVLLERGNSVRAAVRSDSKSQHMRELFKPFGDAKFEVVIVPDMTKVRLITVLKRSEMLTLGVSKDGAWDEAVDGVQAIEHVASPVGATDVNPDPQSEFNSIQIVPSRIFDSYFLDYIGPAVRGTLGILESALKYKCVFMVGPLEELRSLTPVQEQHQEGCDNLERWCCRESLRPASQPPSPLD
jgi:NAD dependent epimerase/dehydratase family